MAAVLDAFASKLAGILVGMAKNEVEMLLGVPGELTKLQATLGDLSCILGDAERKRTRNSAVERWVQELKDVMYDADDILDLCQIMEGSEDPLSFTAAVPKTTSGGWNKSPKKFFGFRNPVVAHQIGKKIQELIQRLEDLEKRSSRFGFITQAIHSSGYSITTAESSSNTKTGSVIIQSDVVGEKIEEATKKIVDLLIKTVDTRVGLKGDSVVVAVGITGTGGIGKTTLARMVFSRVKENFDKRIWLSVNQEVNEISVLQSVLASFGVNCHDVGANKDLLECALNDTVRQKKFLMVMDDVWSEKVWTELLRVPLSSGASGSRVLVTTRNDGVARKMKAQHLHRVDKLEGDDAWILLKKQVVLNEDDEAVVDGLKDIGEKIVERCDGLPLAVKVLGGHLANISRTRGAWMDVCNHFTWSMEGISEDINKAVYLSYEELPSHLKQCFVLCSLYPKGEQIRNKVIIQVWFALGYIDNKMSSKPPEDLGREYYKELVSRNLLESDKGFYDDLACSMHDVVRSFAQHITKDEGMLVSEGHNFSIPLRGSKLRHLSVSKTKVEWAALEKHASLRTLMLFGGTTAKLKDLWNGLACLRVLLLKDTNLEELPDSISQLKHLRYLSLRNNKRLSTIPRGIGDLRFLQCIDLAGCKNISQLPSSILKLRKLRTVNFRGTAITSVPRGFGKLEDLVAMLGFPTHSDESADGWCSLEDLGHLSKLIELEISGLEKAPSGSKAARAQLNSKCHLRQLWLKFTTGRLGSNGEAADNISEEEHERTEQVLANLRPPTCRDTLEIEGYFARRLPPWMRSMSAFGSLRRFVLNEYACCTQLPSGLGQIPFLDYLWILGAPSVQCIDHCFLLPSFGGDVNGMNRTTVLIGTKQTDRRQPCGPGVAFPKLKYLGFKGMFGWKDWEWEQHLPAMPALDRLSIRNCKLQHLPAGLAHHACRLRRLYLSDNEHLISVENFPSLVELVSYDNPKLERISNNLSLKWIDVSSCRGLQVLHDLPSLRSIEWCDLKAKTLPRYFQETELNKLRVSCSLSLLRLISLQDESSEWGKIRHVQQLKAYGKTNNEDGVDRHIFYTKEPYSFEAVIEEDWDVTAAEETFMSTDPKTVEPRLEMFRQAGLPQDPAGVQAGQMVVGTSQLSRYPVDEIVKRTHCELFVPIGRAGKRKRKAAEGLVAPPDPKAMYNGQPIPPDYVLVELAWYADELEDMELDYPIHGATSSTLSTGLDHPRVLWNKADIVVKELKTSQRSPSPSGDPSDHNDSGDDKGGDGDDRGSNGPANSTRGSLGGPSNSPPRSLGPAKSNLTGASERPGTPHPKACKDNNKGECSSLKMSESIWRDKYDPIIVPRMAAYNLVEEYKYTTASNRPQTLPKLFGRSPNCPEHFVNGQFMLPLGDLIEQPWFVRRFHIWYMHASNLGMKDLVVRVPKEYFELDEDCDLVLTFHDMHRMLRRKDLDLALVTLFSLMQSVVSKEIGSGDLRTYLSPMHICQRAIIGYDVSDTDARLAGLDGMAQQEARAHLVGENKKRKGDYILECMKNIRGNGCVVAAHQFGLGTMGHWIVFMIYPQDGWAGILDSSRHTEKKGYMDFEHCLCYAYRKYVEEGNYDRRSKNDKKKYGVRLRIKRDFNCAKQPEGSLECGYYACEFLRASGRFSESWRQLMGSEDWWMKEKVNVTQTIDDICKFVLDDICHVGRPFFNKESPLATDPKFDRLRNWRDGRLNMHDYILP